ncbi:tetratricopeptide repeat protein [Streptomyces canus]|uniref:caspase, EACC1-associated type n=1 Tax=Streptomyces canus TaxID=58343 RepID=UPI0033C35D37
MNELVRLPDAVGSRAVLIGVSSYESERLEDLPSVGRGIHALNAAFTHRDRGSFASDRCLVIENPRDQSALAQPLLGAAMAAEDVFLVYHAGHGLIAGQDRELYLALAGTDPDLAEWTGLPYRLIREAFSRTRARSRVLILDSCHSGLAISGVMSATENSIIGQVDIDGTYVMTSVPAMALAQAPVGDTYTSFTGALLNVLERGIPDGPDLLSMGAVYTELRRLFSSAGLPLPQQASERTAAMIALGRNRTGAAGSPADDESPLVSVEELTEQIREAGVADVRAAISLAREAVSRRTLRLGADHAETLDLRRTLSTWLGQDDQADPSVAIGQSREVVSDHTRVLGPEDSATLRSRITLAHNLFRGKQDDEAFAILTDVHSIRSRILSPGHEDTLRARESLAYLKSMAGQIDESSALYEELIDGYTHTLGRNSFRVLACLNSLAGNTIQKGQAATAADLYRQAADVAERLFGPDDPATLRERKNHMDAIGQTQDFAAAAEISRTLLDDMERVYGPDAPETVDVRHYHASHLSSSDRTTAIRLFRSVCQALEARTGRRDTSTFIPRRNLALTLHDDGQTQEGANLLQGLLEDMTDILGAEHSDTLNCHRWLAEWTGALGHPSRAQRLYRDLVQIEARVLPREDLDALQSRLNYATYTNQIGDHAAAAQIYSEVGDDLAWVLGQDHRATLSARVGHAVSIGQLGDTVRATNLLHQVEADQARYLGKDHPDTSDTRVKIAYWLHSMPKGPYAPPPPPGWLPPAH